MPSAKSLEEVQGYIAQGWKPKQTGSGVWRMYKEHGEGSVYIQVQVVKDNPGFFEKLKSEASDRKEKEANEESPEKIPENKDEKEKAKGSGTNIQSNEFILHDTERRLLETIITLENLHLTPEADRYEIPFANLIADAKGNLIASDGGGGKMENTSRRFSLMDIVVRRLAEIYHKWQAVKDIETERDEWKQAYELSIIERNRLQRNYDDVTVALAIELYLKR